MTKAIKPINRAMTQTKVSLLLAMMKVFMFWSLSLHSTEIKDTISYLSCYGTGIADMVP